MSLTPLRTETVSRWRAIVVALFAALALTFFGALPAQANADNDVIRAVDTVVELDADGVAYVTETYQWDFGNRDGLGFYRELVQYMGWAPDTTKMRHIEYSNFAVSSPSGAPAEVWVESEYGSVIQLAVGAPDGSNETRTGVQTYVLTYEMRGALNAVSNPDGSPGQEELFWNAHTDWKNRIDVATVEVTGPADVTDIACYQGVYQSDEPCDSYSQDGATASFENLDMARGDGFSIMAAYPPGTFANTDPILVDNTSSNWGGGGGNTGSSTPQMPGGDWIASNWPWLAGAWTALLGLITFRRYKKGRDLHYVGLAPNNVPPRGMEDQYRVEPLTQEPPVTVQFHPPAGLTPAEGAVLIEEVANPNHITATITDLAARGYLTIEETGQTMFGKPKDWRLSRVPNPPSGANLRPYEAQLLRDLFSGRASVEISDLSGSFATKVAKYRKELTQISDANGWYTRKGLVNAGASGGSSGNIASRVFMFVFFGIWIMAFMGGGTIAMIATGGSLFIVVAGIFVALVSLVIVMVSTAKMAHARSAKGRALYEQVRGFRQYITTAEAHQLRWEQGEDIFSKFLPWAMVFGDADRWAKMFEQLAAEGVYTTAPAWYISSRPFSPASFSSLGNSMTTFASSAPSTLSYTPGSSGGSGSFGGGGFGGGGGFSGGGVGGGGGGGR